MPSTTTTTTTTNPSDLDLILRRVVVDRERLAPADAERLAQGADLFALGRAADAVCRRLHPEPYRTYNIDRNINYSNVCAAVCDFCAFYRKIGAADAYVLSFETIRAKVEETVALGGDQILIQGGLHPQLPFSWYEDLLRDVKAHFPQVNIHGFSAPELFFFHKKFRMPLKTVLRRLMDAGLGSLPGGGAEILSDRVRSEITRGKTMTEEWLAVHRAWHELGGRSTATMMFGHVETISERIEHLEHVRRLQDETGGFTAFIAWTFQPEHTAMSAVPTVGAYEYLRTQALCRLYLDNVPNIQSSWVTQGPKIGQLGLLFGANDMGSLMIEENVVSSAGTVHHLTVAEIRRAIEEVGYHPRQRNVYYEYLDAAPGEAERKAGAVVAAAPSGTA